MEGLASFVPSNLLYDQEKISQYRPGGYHPVSLGDTIKENRYKIVHKLGWGGFSTVWLARDNLLNEWVAVKIGTASSTAPSQELSILKSLQKHSAPYYAARLVDSFIHIGPNGSHQCIVTELLGPSVDTVVADYHTGGERLEPPTLLRMTKQLLQAVAFLHRKGYAHGDISGANVLFTASHLANLPEESLFGVVGYPQSTTLARKDGKPLGPSLPRQLVRKAGWDDWIDEDDEDIRLIDWGETFVHGAEPTKLAQPADLRAPEIIFSGRFDYRLDLWRVGCTIYSFVFAARPFQYLGGDDVLVRQMINFVEELPAEWQDKWELIQRNSGRGHKAHDEHTQSKLERRFHELVTEPELMPLLPVIQGLMRFLPSNRISADEALGLL